MFLDANICIDSIEILTRLQLFFEWYLSDISKSHNKDLNIDNFKWQTHVKLSFILK